MKAFFGVAMFILSNVYALEPTYEWHTGNSFEEALPAYEGIPYPYKIAKKLEQIDFSVLQEWSGKQLKEGFRRGRDSLLIPTDTERRRIPWLYPQDGSFVRADILSKVLNKYKFPAVKKLFVFGDLKVNTSNTLDRTVERQFNVVPVISSQGQVYVLDPSVEAKHPLKLADWIDRIAPSLSAENNLTYALCDKNTYKPKTSSCFNAKPVEDTELLSTVRTFLHLEKENIKALGKDPSVLTDMPPWRIKPARWGESDRKGNIGEVFKYNNAYANQIDFFRLSRLGGDGRYWHFPTNQKDNWYWAYAGKDFDENFIKDTKSWGSNDRKGTIGDIFKYHNPHSDSIDYFELFRLGGDKRYWHFPTDQKSNWYWQYLEKGYPDTFRYFEAADKQLKAEDCGEACQLGLASSVGGHHSCALKADDTVNCWGNNCDGQTAVPNGLKAKQIALGVDYSCALKTDDTVECWGYQPSGLTSISAGLKVKQIALGGSHSCALKTDDTVACWGFNSVGQATVPNGLKAKQISLGDYNSCALKIDNTVECWGDNEYEQSTVPSGLKAKQIALGYHHSCALKTDDTIECWGDDSSGKTTVPDGLTAKQIALGAFHSCALKTDNTVECWGNNITGQTTVPSGLIAKQIQLGLYHSCALKTDNTVECWGNNYHGQSTAPSDLKAKQL